jgi:hypothetical protein
MRAILLDPEARAGDNPSTPNPFNNFAGHLREPILYFLHVLKGLEGTIHSYPGVEQAMDRMGQRVFFPPSVFSYFSPLTRAPGNPGLYGPEYQTFTPVAALERVNYVDYLLKLNTVADAKPNNAPYAALSGDVESLITAINVHFFHNTMPEPLKKGIRDTLATTNDPAQRARFALYLALTSAHYQFQN